MSDPRLDSLAETARNRGLKLVRSRVRTPSKRRFGKAGLTDASGKPVFGMDAKGPTATADAVEDYLRTLEAQDWGASLSAPETPRRKPKQQAANDQGPPARATAARPPAPPAQPAKPKPAKPKPYGDTKKAKTGAPRGRAQKLARPGVKPKRASRPSSTRQRPR